MTENLFKLEESQASGIFAGLEYPWEALPRIASYLLLLSETLSDEYRQIAEKVWVGKGTSIEKSALVKGPAIIGRNCEIRHGAYLRGNVIIGDGVVVGNSTEIKNSILFNKSQVPHFNYVGDSILGFKVHLGAGVILSNLKSTGGTITVKTTEGDIQTGLRKFGALIGDNSEVGCNSVLNPGTIVGRESIIYPLTFARGYVPERHILKNSGELVKIL